MDKAKSCTVGGACSVGLLGLFCPVCVPVIGAFVSSIGLGFAATTAFMYPMLGLMSAMFLFGLSWNYRRTRNIWPLIIGIVGVIAIPLGRYVIVSNPLIYGGVAAVLGSGGWSVLRSKGNRATVTILAAIALLTLFGFVGYRFGFLTFIKNVMMPGNFAMFSLPFLSVLFGTAAFFSPCALTVLPAYISRFLGEEQEREHSILRLLWLGLLGALGIILVNMIVGLIIAGLGSAAPFAKDPREDILPILAVRAIAGFLIALMGYFTLTGRRVPIPFVQEFLAQGSFSRSIFTYGIFYNAAAVGCTGPILLGLMLFAFQTGSFAAALSAFGIFSATMGIWMVLLTVLAGLFRRPLVRRMIAPAPVLRKITGVVMIVVGLSISILTLEGNRIFVKLFFPFLP